MRNHFPDPAREAGQSLKKIGQAMRQQSGAGWIDRGMNTMTGGLVAAGREVITFPLRTLVFPTMRTVNDLARNTVKGAVGITWDALKRIPWIPVPARNRPTSEEAQKTLASRHDDSTALPRPGGLRIGPGQDAPHPDAEPGSPRRAA